MLDMKLIAEKIEKMGYKTIILTEDSKRPQIQFSKQGIKGLISYKDGQFCYVRYRVKRRGGYTTRTVSLYGTDDPYKVIKDIRMMDKEVVLHEFDQGQYIINNNSISLGQGASNATIKGIVSVQNGKISQDIQRTGNDVWYLFRIMFRFGGSVNIVYNGIQYGYVDDKCKNITESIKHTKNKQLNMMDKLMLDELIKKWTAKI